MITPRNQEALSICGLIDSLQAVPSLYDQITRFARGGGAESNRSLVRSKSDDGSLRTIGGQAPIAFGIDLRGERVFPLLTSNRNVSEEFPFVMLYRQIVDGKRAHCTIRMMTSCRTKRGVPPVIGMAKMDDSVSGSED